MKNQNLVSAGMMGIRLAGWLQLNRYAPGKAVFMPPPPLLPCRSSGLPLRQQAAKSAKGIDSKFPSRLLWITSVGPPSSANSWILSINCSHRKVRIDAHRPKILLCKNSMKPRSSLIIIESIPNCTPFLSAQLSDENQRAARCNLWTKPSHDRYVSETWRAFESHNLQKRKYNCSFSANKSQACTNWDFVNTATRARLSH